MSFRFGVKAFQLGQNQMISSMRPLQAEKCNTHPSDTVPPNPYISLHTTQRVRPSAQLPPQHAAVGRGSPKKVVSPSIHDLVTTLHTPLATGVVYTPGGNVKVPCTTTGFVDAAGLAVVVLVSTAVGSAETVPVSVSLVVLPAPRVGLGGL